MTIKFTSKSEKSGLSEDLVPLMELLNGTITKDKRAWDVRTIYSALTVLQESYREGMRSAWTGEKAEFDAFIDSMNVYLTTFASGIIRPVFEGVIEEGKKNDGR